MLGSWNLYNATCAVAARLNLVFSKVFIFSIERLMPRIRLDVYANLDYSAPDNNERLRKFYMDDTVHLVATPGIDETSVFFNLFPTGHLEKNQLHCLAHELGLGLATSYYTPDEGFLDRFDLVYDEELNFEGYMDTYDIYVGNEHKHFEADYPLPHYLKTEYELEEFWSNHYGYKEPIKSISRNGIPLFDLDSFIQKDRWCIIRIMKLASEEFKVEIEGHNLAEYDDYSFDDAVERMRIMSYIGQMTAIERIQNHGVKDGCSPYMELYFSTSKHNNFDNYVLLERVRNFGLTIEDLQWVISDVCVKLRQDSSTDWSKIVIY